MAPRVGARRPAPPRRSGSPRTPQGGAPMRRRPASPPRPCSGEPPRRHRAPPDHGAADRVGHVAEGAFVALQPLPYLPGRERQGTPSLADDIGELPPPVEPHGHGPLEEVVHGPVVIAPAAGSAN